MRIIMRAVFVLAIGTIEAFFIIALPVRVANAADAAGTGPGLTGTHVSGTITTDAIWDESGSPYILDGDIDVAKYQTLTLAAGAHIISPASSTISVHGRLDMKGTLKDPVDISDAALDIDPDGVYTGSFAFLHGGASVRLIRATGQIDSVLIQGAPGAGMTIDGGWFRGRRLRIEKGAGPGVSIMATGSSSDPATTPDVRINESSFVSNASGAVVNAIGIDFDFTKDWWGTADGPAATGADAITGQLRYGEWPNADPTIGRIPTGPLPACCSSILFIPGLEGTRLYDGSSDRLWEPLGNADVKKLQLTPDGLSASTVIAGAPIDEAYGFKGIYGSFMRFLDGLVTTRTVNGWHAFGYDWRLPGGTDALNADSDAAMPEAIQLAAGSQTGKIIVIAHSAGGFVAKKILNDISAAGRSAMVDAFIGIGVPWTGAPEAIAGLLHGDHQEIAGGILARASAMRDLGQTMPSAYGLLPTAGYFASALLPSITFASTTMPGLNDGSYPASIVSPRDQQAFMTDAYHVRMQPDSVDVSSVFKSSSPVFSIANSMRSFIGSFDWPFRLPRWSLAGWGRDTTVTVAYDLRPGCAGFIGSLWCRGRSYFHRLVASIMGDGTVPLASAADEHDHLVTMDLGSMGKREGADYSHANMLESSTTQDIVMRIIRDTSAASFAGLAGVASDTAPTVGQDRPHIDVTVHSNARLDVYDEHGAHTGPAPAPAPLAQNDAIGAVYETGIPGSSFSSTGEGDGAYAVVRLPYERGRTYSIVIHGAGYGFFTAGLSVAQPGSDPDAVQFTTEPLSPIMVATTSVDVSSLMDSPGPALAAIPPLHVDIDDDGTPDYAASIGGNGVPGNATTSDEANRIAREESIEAIQKTDTPALHDDPARRAFLAELFPPGTNGPIPAATSTPVQSVQEQKTPPSSGSASCPSQ